MQQAWDACVVQTMWWSTALKGSLKSRKHIFTGWPLSMRFAVLFVIVRQDLTVRKQLGVVEELISTKVSSNWIADNALKNRTQDRRQAYWSVVIGECFLSQPWKWGPPESLASRQGWHVYPRSCKGDVKLFHGGNGGREGLDKEVVIGTEYLSEMHCKYVCRMNAARRKVSLVSAHQLWAFNITWLLIALRTGLYAGSWAMNLR